MNSFKNNISRNIQAAIGWRTKRKILVIESDDWGSIRMPSNNSYSNLLKNGIPVDKSPYNKLDALESEEDIYEIYDFLEKTKDSKNKNLKITANTIMANPNFRKIKESNFNEYHYITLNETYEKYNGNSNVLNLFKEGIKNESFIPQLHGREHLQSIEWLKALKSGDYETLIAFENQVWGHPQTYFKDSKMDFSSAFHILNSNQLDFANRSIHEASKMFKDVFGYQSKSFIAPRYIWDTDIEKTLSVNGIKYIQGKIVQLVPIPNNPNKFKNKVNYLGKKNKFGQIYLTRNVFFEPAQNPKFDWLADAMNRIRIAYKWGKPAIISMHRLNFMGGLEINNRKENLELLGVLINKVILEFPEVEFLSSNELGKIINNE
jgi:hypothetical protein